MDQLIELYFELGTKYGEKVLLPNKYGCIVRDS